MARNIRSPFSSLATPSKGLPPDGDWKCLKVAEMTNVELRAGEWYAGSSHRERQQCVKKWIST